MGMKKDLMEMDLIGERKPYPAGVLYPPLVDPIPRTLLHSQHCYYNQ